MQVAPEKKTVSIMPEGKEDLEVITSKHTGTTFFLLEKGAELDWLFQRALEWNKFKDSKQDGKKHKKFNTFWYNTKRSKDKNRSAAYSVLVSGAIATASFEKDFFEKGNELMEKLASQTNSKSAASSAHANINSDLLESGSRLVQILRRRSVDSFELWSKSSRDSLHLSMFDLKKEINDDVTKQVDTRLEKAKIIETEIYERRSGNIQLHYFVSLFAHLLSNT